MMTCCNVILWHTQKNGFETPLDEISEAHSGLLQPLGQSKLMVLNPSGYRIIETKVET